MKAFKGSGFESRRSRGCFFSPLEVIFSPPVVSLLFLKGLTCFPFSALSPLLWILRLFHLPPLALVPPSAYFPGSVARSPGPGIRSGTWKGRPRRWRSGVRRFRPMASAGQAGEAPPGRQRERGCSGGASGGVENAPTRRAASPARRPPNCHAPASPGASWQKCRFLGVTPDPKLTRSRWGPDFKIKIKPPPPIVGHLVSSVLLQTAFQ